MIVSLSGLIGSGKDTVGDFLVDTYGFKRESFASTLKDAVAAVFGWDREMLEGRTKAAREERERVDTWWAERLGIPHLTPRWILQHWGTEVCRQGFHNDIWIASLENKLRKTSDNIIITDARFPNELNMVQRLDGKCVYVERGDQPDWYNWAYKYNRMTDEKAKLTKQIIASLPEHEPNPINRRIHASEWSWIGYNFDYEIDNNGSLGDLVTKVTEFAVSLKSPVEA
jgi:hypothetical protein